VCSEADIKKNNFSANFPSFSVFQCVASGLVPLRRSSYTSGCARPVACLCGNTRPDELMIHPYEDPTGYISHV
jgi:hypothetical protein